MIWGFWGPGFRTLWQSSVPPNKTSLRCLEKRSRISVTRPHRAPAALYKTLGPENPKSAHLNSLLHCARGEAQQHKPNREQQMSGSVVVVALGMVLITRNLLRESFLWICLGVWYSKWRGIWWIFRVSVSRETNSSKIRGRLSVHKNSKMRGTFSL